MAEYRDRFFKHALGLRSHPGILALEQAGFKNAYRHWCVILELAYENDADLNDGIFEINSHRLARELRVKVGHLSQILDAYALELSLVCDRCDVATTQVWRRYTTAKPYLIQISIPNLLKRKGRRLRSAKIEIRRDKEEIEKEIEMSEVNFLESRNERFLKAWTELENEKRFDSYRSLGLDLDPEYVMMENWVKENPKKWKKNYRLFIIGWLNRALKAFRQSTTRRMSVSNADEFGDTGDTKL